MTVEKKVAKNFVELVLEKKQAYKAIEKCSKCNDYKEITFEITDRETISAYCEESHEVNIDRRTFLRVASTFAGGIMSIGGGLIVLKIDDERKDRVAEHKSDVNVRDFIENIGFNYGRFHIDKGKKSAVTNLFHKDHEAASDSLESAIKGIFEGNVIKKSHNDYFWIKKESHLALLGGPNANPLTKIAFGFEGPDDSKLNISDKCPLKIRYYGLSDASTLKDDKIKIRIQGEPNILQEKINWGFYDRKSGHIYNCKEFNEDRQPKHDPLLITKIPNIFSESYQKDNLNLLILDGAHNIATRSFELLFDNTDLLKEINSEISRKQYYQILLDARDVEPFDENGDEYHKASRLKIIDIHELPYGNDHSYKSLHDYANKRLKEIGIYSIWRWTPKVGQPDGCCKLKARR